MNNSKWISNLSRHSEVEGSDGGNEAGDDEGDDEALQHVQEQLPRVAHVAETESLRSISHPSLKTGQRICVSSFMMYLACLGV